MLSSCMRTCKGSNHICGREFTVGDQQNTTWHSSASDYKRMRMELQCCWQLSSKITITYFVASKNYWSKTSTRYHHRQKGVGDLFDSSCANTFGFVTSRAHWMRPFLSGAVMTCLVTDRPAAEQCHLSKTVWEWIASTAGLTLQCSYAYRHMSAGAGIPLTIEHKHHWITPPQLETSI